MNQTTVPNEEVAFWNKHFGKDTDVLCRDFAKAFCAEFPKYPSKVLFQIMDAFLGRERVSFKALTSFLAKFGFLKNSIACVTSNFFSAQGNLFEWFYPNISREHAKRRIGETRFLVRNSSQTNCFVFAYVKEERGLKELLIEARRGAFLLFLSDNNKATIKSIPALIKDRMGGDEEKTAFEPFSLVHGDKLPDMTYDEYLVSKEPRSVFASFMTPAVASVK